MNSNLTLFCSDKFWDSEISWNTKEPRLTRCFAQAGLTIIPSLLFLPLMVFEFVSIFKSPNKRISINKYNVTRFLTCLFIVVLNMILLINYSYSMIFLDDNQYTLVDFFASFSKLHFSVSLIILYHYHRINGIITSGTMFAITLLLSATSGIVLLDSIAYNSEMYADFEKQNASRVFLCVFSLFVLSCFTDNAEEAGLKPSLKRKEKKDKENLIDSTDDQSEYELEKNVSPKKYSSFLSKITFWWYTKFVRRAAKRQIEMKDIYELEEHLQIENTTKRFEMYYYDELQRIEDHNKTSDKKVKFNTWRGVKVLAKCHGFEFLIISFVKLLFDILNYVSPLLLSALIRHTRDPNQPNWHGALIVIGFVVSSFLKNILINNYFERGIGLGLSVRSTFTSLIFDKALRMSPKAKKNRTTGEIVNLISIDTKEMKTKDIRIKFINEMLSGIRIIKLYSWEQAFIDKITAEREKEVKDNQSGLRLGLIGFVFFSISPTLVLACTISVYIFTGIGAELTAEKAFVSIALFNLLQFPMEVFPWIFTYLTMTKVSLDRICSFLAEDELEGYAERKFDEKMAITIKNKARFAWNNETHAKEDDKNGKQDSPKEIKFRKSKSKEKIELEAKIEIKQQKEFKNFELKDIELDVHKGSFVAVIGQVGSGKSSLLSAILGEMHLVENESGEKGEVNISEEQTFCYVAQQAWIQNNSLRGNVLFGKEFNEEIYKEVISACALEPDLQQLEANDETEIGEKGINLSGGQKQRVSLARACYASLSVGDNKQIILLDDPLSAVDATTGKHLCQNVLNSKTGILKDTTRILVTNQLNQLVDLNVDQVVLLKDGQIRLKCTYEELMEMEKEKKLEEYDLRLDQNESIGGDIDGEDKKSDRSGSQTTSEESKKKEVDLDKKDHVNSGKKNLILSERHERGRVDFKNYKIYLKYFGIRCAILVITFLVGDNAFSVWSRNYLAIWTSSKPESNSTQHIREFNKNHMLNYIYISIFQCIFSFLGNFIVLFGIVSTIKLFHRNLLYKVLRSPMSFFDTTPLGRIVNRFSKDIDAIDKTLPLAIREGLLASLNLLASIAIILFKQPSSFIFYFFIFVLYYFVMDLYIESSRQLKRFESTTRSPIYSHFGETITGTQTIRAYNKVADFENESRSKIETNNRAIWYTFQGNRWLSLYLDLLGSLILIVVSVQIVFQKDTTNAGQVGLLITYCLNLTQFLTYVVRFYSMFEANAVSIERINEYCENEEEDEWIKPFRPDAKWPEKGEIEFKDYSTRYRKGTNLVLKNLSFKVDSTEKVGVVGRTGAGKSTITLALFRIIEPAEGQILIDGLDIGQIGLHDLRSKLSCIPQDPVLFTGSIRFNLDPFNKHSDHEIYESLEHAHLRNYVNTLENGIEHSISEGGENLSVGQRQLICLARALLRKSKIIAIDEGTASVDFATDELVQQTIRSEFKNCTIITIAHRLKTVIDSSRILVLEKGELREYDEPQKLLENPDSLFYLLAQKANLV